MRYGGSTQQGERLHPDRPELPPPSGFPLPSSPPGLEGQYVSIFGDEMDGGLAILGSDDETQLTVQQAPGGTAILMKLIGGNAGSANLAWIGFYDSDEVRTAFIGDGSSLNSDLYLFADVGHVRLEPGPGKEAQANGLFANRFEDTATNSLTTVQTVGHNSSLSPVTGFGGRHRWQLEDDTSPDQNAFDWEWFWTDATHATRKSRMVGHVYDTAAREWIRVEGDGSAARVGVLGAAAVVRQTVSGSRRCNQGLATEIAAMAAFGWVTDSSTLGDEVALADGATITVDVTLDPLAYTVTLAGNRTIAFSGTPYNRQRIEIIVKQDGSGSRLLTWPAAVRYNTDLTGIVLTTTAGKKDRILFEYDAADAKYDLLSVVHGT